MHDLSLRGAPEPDELVQASARHLRDSHERWTLHATPVNYSTSSTLSPQYCEILRAEKADEKVVPLPDMGGSHPGRQIAWKSDPCSSSEAMLR